MRTKLISMAIIAFAFCSAFALLYNDLHEAMNKMMQKMKSMSMTGDPDHDFAMMMAERHQGSIDMSEIIVKAGKDEKVKMLAQSILDKQTKEQKRLRAHSKSGNEQSHAAHNQSSGSSTSKEVSGFSAEMKQAMDGMESGMHSMKMTNNLDHDFATMMIPHHQSAIQMSDAILKHGKDQQIKNIAETIKSDSQEEIGELKTWLQNHGK